MLVIPSVTVVSEGRNVNVEVRQLPQSRRDGFCCLADIWRLARLPGRLSELAFDFVGADGFRLSKKCDARLGGAALVRGFVHRTNRNLVWDEALELPCFFFVKGLASIVAERCVGIAPGGVPSFADREHAGGCACDHARHG